MKVVTRFAPSPTGNLHIGGLRTALFNFLYAKNNNGKFILRIEDTDKKRSSNEFLNSIIQGLDWLNIKSDDVFYQSQRETRHKEVAHLILEKGLAYESDGAIRLKINKDQLLSFNDLILKEVIVDPKQIEDVVILRSDGSPTYMLAVVVDDHDMEITHVIRGNDHLTNTFKQILIYRSLNWKIPKFAHIPLIHNLDGTKLSKRDGATNVIDFKNLGFMPEAIFNYLLRLGWSHGDKEIFSADEAIKLFNLDAIGKSPACFDMEKLYSLNSYYIKNLSTERVLEELLQFLPNQKIDEKMLKNGIEIFKTRVNSLKALAENMNFYFQNIDTDQQINCDLLRSLRNTLINSEWNENLNSVLKNYANENNLSMKEIYTNLRLAILGKENSPSIIEILLSLGKGSTINKVDYILSKNL
jgi:glutamyl-tRNA synthetase